MGEDWADSTIGRRLTLRQNPRPEAGFTWADDCGPRSKGGTGKEGLECPWQLELVEEYSENVP